MTLSERMVESTGKPAAKFRVVIPARFESTRFPGKVLQDLAGKPLVAHVYAAAVASGASDVVIATDDERVASAATAFGADVCLTASTHRSGTDRIHEVAVARGWHPQDCVINVQGDEPLMPPELISDIATALSVETTADIATACIALDDEDSFNDPNVVKVVRDARNMALYFSRAPIPWDRDRSREGRAALPSGQAYRHLGIYGYRVESLARYAGLPPSAVEEAESLEQLRALSAGMRIVVITASRAPGPGVDTPSDLLAVAGLLESS